MELGIGRPEEGNAAREQASAMLQALGFAVPPLEDLEPEYMAEQGEYGDKDLEMQVMSSSRVFDGELLHVDEVELAGPDGNSYVHEVIRHPGAVAIVALNEQRQMLVVRQWRTSLERLTLEIPAGKLEPGEDPQACALRELQEEAGLIAKKIKYLIPVACAAGYSDEIIHLFMASELEPSVLEPDEGEFIRAEWIDLDELLDMVLDGRIEDSKTIIAALACDAIARRLQ